MFSSLTIDSPRRNNIAKDCDGVGVRLGGAKVNKYQYGQANDVR